MAWPKGKPRPEGAGRKKGTPNKSTEELFEICKKYNCDPFEGMVIIASQEKDLLNKFQMLKEIAQYLYPKRKAIEVSNQDQNGLAIVIKDYSK